MKVLIVNTSERTGGAAVAAHRLAEALTDNGVKASMLVGIKETDDINVAGLPHRWLHRWHFAWERLRVLIALHLHKEHLFKIDTATSGTDITRLNAFRQADVVHLHWVNQGMLSLSDLRRILAADKPVVWTMHDMWPATAICHLTLGCRQFTTQCRQCKYLEGGSSSLAARVWKRKRRLFSQHAVTMVACSQWLEGEARSSAMLEGQLLRSVPNPINTHLYKPADKQEARRAEQLPADRLLMLFACQNVAHANKGMTYLIEACKLLAAERPDLKERLTLVVLGGHADEVAGAMPFDVVAPGYVDNEQRLIRIYQSADVFVLPSLSENLPNTIMEAMACGVPCVGFRVGGIPEMIDHKKNGYVAELRNSADLARGLLWVLCEADGASLRRQALSKVAHSYSQSSVALRYIEIYQEAMAQKNLKL